MDCIPKSDFYDANMFLPYPENGLLISQWGQNLRIQFFGCRLKVWQAKLLVLLYCDIIGMQSAKVVQKF